MKYIQDFTVTENINLNGEHFILNVHAPEALPEILPGQFMEILVKDSMSTFLRRPISIHNVDYINNTLSLFIKRVGEGTRHLGSLKENDILNIVYPLGNSFSVPEDDNFLLIGGGCGVAPLLYLANYLSKMGFKPSVLIGAKTKNDIHELEIFHKFGKIYVTTEDGSLGEKGFVTDHSAFSIQHSAFSKFYACGPEPMLKAVAKIAKQKNTELEVSLENTMACGIGACLCCIVETREGNKCVCTEGPVFNIKDLKWN
jgi:dihydroorotate dehydrogenase electron transfer subunit